MRAFLTAPDRLPRYFVARALTPEGPFQVLMFDGCRHYINAVYPKNLEAYVLFHGLRTDPCHGKDTIERSLAAQRLWHASIEELRSRGEEVPL